MRNVLATACALMTLAACAKDINSPTAMNSKKAIHPVKVVSVAPPTSPTHAPDVAGAEAAVAALRQRILDIAPAESRDFILASLNRPGSSIQKTSDPKLSDLLGQYYAALTRINVEKYRQSSVDAVYERPIGIHAVVALGADEPGANAVILRRRLVEPMTVILLHENATDVDLGAALGALDQSRATDGDELLEDQRIVVRQAHASGKSNPAEAARLRGLLAKLQNAKVRNIEGIGARKAIEVKTNRLTRSTGSAKL